MRCIEAHVHCRPWLTYMFTVGHRRMITNQKLPNDHNLDASEHYSVFDDGSISTINYCCCKIVL
jgi:hypothetical protein